MNFRKATYKGTGNWMPDLTKSSLFLYSRVAEVSIQIYFLTWKAFQAYKWKLYPGLEACIFFQSGSKVFLAPFKVGLCGEGSLCVDGPRTTLVTLSAFFVLISYALPPLHSNKLSLGLEAGGERDPARCSWLIPSTLHVGVRTGLLEGSERGKVSQVSPRRNNARWHYHYGCRSKWQETLRYFSTVETFSVGIFQFYKGLANFFFYAPKHH